jgi:uncharacterized protein
VIVVADTSVLINLCCVQQGGLLKSLFNEVVIPPEVKMEFLRLAASVPRFTGLVLPQGVREQKPSILLSAVQAEPGLDVGESAALSLAMEIKADAILVDERRGHEVALKLGLRTIGIIGILLKAKSAGLIPAVLPVLIELKHEAGFWISDKLLNRVAQLAEEV